MKYDDLYGKTAEWKTVFAYAQNSSDDAMSTGIKELLFFEVFII